MASTLLGFQIRFQVLHRLRDSPQKRVAEGKTGDVAVWQRTKSKACVASRFPWASPFIPHYRAQPFITVSVTCLQNEGACIGHYACQDQDVLKDLTVLDRRYGPNMLWYNMATSTRLWRPLRASVSLGPYSREQVCISLSVRSSS